MKQKFRMFSFVHVQKEMLSEMHYFESDFDAIVGGTYLQLHGDKTQDSFKSYSLYQMKNGKIVNEIAWYHEDDLTLLEHQDRDRAEEMIEEYRLRDGE